MSKETKDKPEEMASFFDLRAAGYEDHMQETINSFTQYYATVAVPIPHTTEPISVLDLGCGTGLELRWIFAQAPNAKLTCVDVSENMLKVLQRTYRERCDQIRLIQDSYVRWPFGQDQYDYVVSVMTMHHFVSEDKVALYKKIRQALKPGGQYIEGDYVVSPEKERELLETYWQLCGDDQADEGLYHVDVPCSLEVQKQLFETAGFQHFYVLFEEGEHFIYVVK